MQSQRELGVSLKKVCNAKKLAKNVACQPTIFALEFYTGAIWLALIKFSTVRWKRSGKIEFVIDRRLAWLERTPAFSTDVQ